MPPGVGERLARWFGRGQPGAAISGVARDQAARLAGQTLPVPWAALWAQAQAGPGNAWSTGQWLWLEPVRMVAGMNSVMMAPPASALDGRALQFLAKLLQPVLSDAGARLDVGAGRLLARFEGPLDVRCTPPESAFGTDLREGLPQGPDAGPLRRLITECQMVLHQAAESSVGVPGGINGVWPWGEGQAAMVPGPPGATARVFSNDPLLLALDGVLASGTGRRPLNDAGTGASGASRLLTALAQPDQTRRLIWVGSAADGDLGELLATAEAALHRGRLSRIELSWWPARTLAGASHQLLLRRLLLWRWWRKPVRPWVAAE